MNMALVSVAVMVIYNFIALLTFAWFEAQIWDYGAWQFVYALLWPATWSLLFVLVMVRMVWRQVAGRGLPAAKARSRR
jgi:hypothetical protein